MEAALAHHEEFWWRCCQEQRDSHAATHEVVPGLPAVLVLLRAPCPLGSVLNRAACFRGCSHSSSLHAKSSALQQSPLRLLQVSGWVGFGFCSSVDLILLSYPCLWVPDCGKGAARAGTLGRKPLRLGFQLVTVLRYLNLHSEAEELFP